MWIDKTIKIGLLITVWATLSVQAEMISYDMDIDEELGMMSTSSTPVPRELGHIRQRIVEQDERIDGLITIIEGLSASLNELRFNNSQAEAMTSSEPQSQINDVILQKLANMIDEINENYVSKKELKGLIAGYTPAKVMAKNTKTTTEASATQVSPSLKGKSNASLYSEGVRHFFKKRYQ
ncbi:MAG: hypothetical protein Q9M36_08805 [Sulfurovum sp.]|nr:hypothetical protein [Sulfurovum sp.]